jgi:hypothetical protein
MRYSVAVRRCRPELTIPPDDLPSSCRISAFWLLLLPATTNRTSTSATATLKELYLSFDDKVISMRVRSRSCTKAQSETASTRLLWAGGYYADKEYYFATIRVAGLQKHGCARRFVSANGSCARLELKAKGEKSVGLTGVSNAGAVRTMAGDEEGRA